MISINVSIGYNDPYYILNSDQTMKKLVAINLNATNFVCWKRNVIRVIVAKKKKLGFLDTSIAKPDSISEDFNRWLTCDYLLVS